MINHHDAMDVVGHNLEFFPTKVVTMVCEVTPTSGYDHSIYNQNHITIFDNTR
jgi:hypothetical protein